MSGDGSAWVKAELLARRVYQAHDPSHAIGKSSDVGSGVAGSDQ